MCLREIVSINVAHPLSMFLRKLDATARLSEEERRSIASLPINIRDFAAQQDIASEGERPTHTCILLEGWVCRYRLRQEGKRQILALFVPGDAPDLQSLHLPIMDHSICALTAARIVMIPHQSIRDLTAHHPGLAALLWRETLMDAALFREWMVGMGRRSALEQVAHLCCEMYVRQRVVGLADDGSCAFPITRTDLGDALGLTSVHISRVHSELKERRLVTLKQGRMVIHDWNRLRAIAEFDPAYLHLAGPIAA